MTNSEKPPLLLDLTSKHKVNIKPKRKSRSLELSYHRYIHQVLKELHPGFSLSRLSLDMMNSVINDLFNRINQEAKQLAGYRKGKTVNEKDIQAACQLLIPDRLKVLSLSEGTKAYCKYLIGN